MTTDMYTALAPYYDALMADVDYGAWADFLCGEFAKAKFAQVNEKVRRVLDIGCGTGAITVELAKRGYELTGADISSDMLAVAERRSREADAGASFIMQDMRELRLANRVDAAVCCIDSLNYLTKGLNRCFSAVRGCLNEGGLFIFDVNTPYKFENIYAGHDYILENEGVLCAWQNDYDPSSRICEFALSLFIEQPDGSYIRRDELQRERCYSDKELKAALLRNGFILLGEYGSTDRSSPTNTDERRFYTALRV